VVVVVVVVGVDLVVVGAAVVLVVVVGTGAISAVTGSVVEVVVEGVTGASRTPGLVMVVVVDGVQPHLPLRLPLWESDFKYLLRNPLNWPTLTDTDSIAFPYVSWMSASAGAVDGWFAAKGPASEPEDN
jgi:hypothetical protein